MDTSATSAENKLATAKTILSTAASVAATVMLARTDYFYFRLRKFCNRFSSQLTIVIDEHDGLAKNQIYDAAKVYLGKKTSPSVQRIKVSKPEKENHVNISMESDEQVVDVFNGIKLKWVLVCRQVESRSFNHSSTNIQAQVRYFELTFLKKYKDVVIGSYLPCVEKEAKSVQQESKTIKILTVNYNNLYCNWTDAWIPVNLDHPATFETLAMEQEQKTKIMQDLERFVKRKDYYRRVGKAWKRGYLLYGPPGTGKSSLIAAMANYLNFDVYDLELTELRSNSDLRTLLVATANRSILVMEDIDCTIDLQDRLPADTAGEGEGPIQQNKVTLSGFLNFIDGLWSSCGDERIIVFTTNHKEKLDPALLRPGRMDVHVHMSYCTPSGFKLLAANYLGIKEHILFEEIEELISTTQVTPAEVAEQLMRNDDPELILNGLIEFLKVKRKEDEDAKPRKIHEESTESQ
ncbi:protein HYPER-SENSITIVITY-RELATED 4 [Citrus sinensis]|uniref:Protein HYPER-SENSITIVITY-RELATED 4 n=1 Tax=Citrus sinensis TaxID=2711 RepID=A0ACB8J0P6_CITSI|nr:protein HYPER-SENSITIVITY-RELATED 4 [Citrus sinensis]